MGSSVHNLPARRPAGSVAVLAVRSLDDLTGGAGRYRVNWSASVGEEPRQTRTVVGSAALRAEVQRWLALVLGEDDPER
jgi:hypothetical protein